MGTKKMGKQKKVDLLIFMCLAIRDIYIEIVQDMESKAFVLTLIKCCNTNAVPGHTYSENARSFNSAFGGDVIEHHLDSKE